MRNFCSICLILCFFAKSLAQPYAAYLKASFDIEKTTGKTEMQTPEDDGDDDAKSFSSNEFRHPRNSIDFTFSLNGPSVVRYDHYLIVQIPQQSFAINTPPPECC